jgi:aryl-alcohol dehydrogenase-like predicted oxidoreductase
MVVPLEEQWEALHRAVLAGKVREVRERER